MEQNWVSEAVPSIMAQTWLIGSQIVNKKSHLQTQYKWNSLQMVAFQTCFNSSSEIHALIIFQDY